jgi:hypothetical protein
MAWHFRKSLSLKVAAGAALAGTGLTSGGMAAHSTNEVI